MSTRNTAAAAGGNYGHSGRPVPVPAHIAYFGEDVFGKPAQCSGFGYARVLRDRTALVSRFRRLANQWIAATENMSVIDDMIAHPAYLEIVGMGPSALPLLLDELERAPNHWFPALTAVSGGQNPVDEEDAGDLDKMTEAWMQWARENSYR